MAAGYVLARLLTPAIRFEDFPTSIIVQFTVTFGVWIAAEAIGLSGILTIVVYAMTIANTRGQNMPARLRVPVYAVWEAVVFILNAMAFVLIGMQIGPIWERLTPDMRGNYVLFAATVLAVVVLTRFAWVMSYNKLIRWRIERHGFNPPRPMARPTREGGIAISWAGMRGIVTLAAAFSIPEVLRDGTPFPYRDLILFTAFAVVFGTLVLQGLTLKPLILWLGLSDNDPVGREVRYGRVQAYKAAMASIGQEDSLAAKLLRKEYGAIVELCEVGDEPAAGLPGGALRLQAITAARARAIELRRTFVIGDDAFHVLEEELDWAELSAAGRNASA